MSSLDPYRRIAGIYDKTVGRLNAGVLDAALRFHPPQPGWRVLDVGCGTGVALERYGAAGCSLAGVDVSPAMLGVARQRLGESADLREVGGADLPFEDGSFDLVTASMVIHEIPRDDRPGVLSEMARVTAHDGAMLITDFRFGSLRGLRGPATKAVIYLVEALSGHFGGFRSFRAGGGLQGPAEGAGLQVSSEKILAGGNIALYLSRGGR